MALLNDFGVFFGWVGSILSAIIGTFLLPLNFVFSYVKAFLINVFSAPVSSGLTYNWDAGILSTFQAIPYWSLIQNTLIIGLGVIVAVFILKQFQKI